MSVSLQIRRDLAANWSAVNPVLADGEWGLEKDTRKLKMGDGVTAWNALAYIQVEGEMGPQGTPGDGVNVGDIVTTVRNPGASYLECNGAVYEKASYATLSGLLDPNAAVLDNNQVLTSLTTTATAIGGTITDTSQLHIDTDATGTYTILMDQGLTNKIEVYKRTGDTIEHIAGSVVGLNITTPRINGTAISPDGNYIAVGGSRTSTTGSLHLFKRTGDNFNYLKTIDTGTTSTTTINAQSESQIKYSPDGKYLAYQNIQGTLKKLFYVDGEEYTSIATDTIAASTNGGVSFSEDSKYVYFDSVVFELSGTSAQQLTSTNSINRYTAKNNIGQLQLGWGSSGATIQFDGWKLDYAVITGKYTAVNAFNSVPVRSIDVSDDKKLVALTKQTYATGTPSLNVFHWTGSDFVGVSVDVDPNNVRRVRFAGTGGQYLFCSTTTFPHLKVYKRGLSYNPTTHFTVPSVPTTYSGAYPVKTYIRAL